ncbi:MULTISPECIES: helix-turn-helix domain-containing protein [unclassified Bacillus (in: firmicutes)]|uniref:helix-turn-helix domain-containing protein n=1 Tax=unclassified Bacillus (in: firmicutes) TaxID=185979 RepID=UPI001BE7D66F|nr:MULTISPECIES: helix-turn-helix domain-containing protein [unclassified Bacillus (in: firmicutes)]MBT2618618.1 helix-turn-helix domain-containing protein [Bacillus sp. ISL-78]MBT2628914.1 helix-turn-helix domain-containing protein [Bacillus sp. ISL-101]MBT2715006.1 helix-turn-helix domain-containing protein [Bacillus sp. ISL-57]
MKKRIYIFANEEAYNNLSSFTDIEELNKTVRVYRDTIRTDIKRADVQSRFIILLELLKRHSCKQIGVSYMCKNTIASKLEVSHKTVQRLMKKLEDLGMIHQVPMKRKKDMMQTANAILIQPVNDEMSGKAPVKESKKCPTIKTTTSFLKQNIKNNKRKAIAQFSHVDSSLENSLTQANFVAHWVPVVFSNLVSSFYEKAETIQEFWKVIKQCNRVVDYSTNKRAFTGKQEIEIGTKAFKEFAMKVKSGVKMHKGQFAYFNGIVNKLMNELYFDEEFMDNFN